VKVLRQDSTPREIDRNLFAALHRTDPRQDFLYGSLEAEQR
jgi:hypothetical protein